MADSFEDIVSDYHSTSALYGAVMRAEQEGPDLAPIMVGVHAWRMLDERQQDDSLRELLTAYVRLARLDRAAGLEEEAQALLDNLGPIPGDEK